VANISCNLLFASPEQLPIHKNPFAIFSGKKYPAKLYLNFPEDPSGEILPEGSSKFFGFKRGKDFWEEKRG